MLRVTFSVFLFMNMWVGAVSDITSTATDPDLLHSTREGSCRANVCFALAGTNTLSRKDFKDQKRITISVVQMLSKSSSRLRLAAVQYGVSNSAISPITGDVSKFARAVKSSRQLSESGSFLAAGLNYCFSELNRIGEGSKKIVLLGDGQSTIGVDAGDRASLFIRTGGEVFTVGVGNNQDKSSLLEVAGGIRRFFSLRRGVTTWTVATSLFRAICE